MENLSKTEVVLLVIIAFLFFRVLKELAWIRLYGLVIKLKAEGKLIPENDPNNIVEKMRRDLVKHTKPFV